MDLQGMFEKIMPKARPGPDHDRRRGPADPARPGVRGPARPREDQRGRPSRWPRSPGSSSSTRSTRSPAARTAAARGPDVSRQGVQRDLLPIVEGTTVNTKYGPVKTDHVLFVAAGAFHRAKPSDLMPELQGRFPIRVELKDLTRDDFARILREPRASLIVQYQALLATEGLEVEFAPDAIDAMADLAHQVNRIDPEHRRPAAPHDPRAGRRGTLLRGPRPRREAGHHRRRLRPRAARRRSPRTRT